MALTDLAIRTAKPDEKPRKLVDEKGMYLLLQPTGAKLWRMNYRFDGKQKTLALGTYPETSLSQARDKRDEARKKLAQDIDPGEQRKLEKQERRTSLANTFEVIARDWMKVRGKEWSEGYAGKTRACMERHAFPSIGSKPIKDITAPELLAMLRAIEKRGTVDMAHRIQQHCGAVFRYAISTGVVDADPTPSLHGALSTVKTQHYAAITDPKDFAELLRAIDGYRGEVTTKIAMLMLAYPKTLSSALRRLRDSLRYHFTNIDLNPLAIFKPGNATIINPIEDERSNLVCHFLDVHHLGFG